MLDDELSLEEMSIAYKNSSEIIIYASTPISTFYNFFYCFARDIFLSISSPSFYTPFLVAIKKRAHLKRSRENAQKMHVTDNTENSSTISSPNYVLIKPEPYVS